MSRIKSLAFVLVVGMIFFACSKGRQDPMGIDDGNGLTEGRLTKGTSGPNLLVTPSNSGSACQIIDEEIFSTYLKASSVLSAGSELDEAVRVTGDYSGYIVVDGSSTFSGRAILYNFDISFYDYSDSGLIFIGGGLQCAGSLNYFFDDLVRQDVLVNGEIKFAGSYTGFIKFNRFILHVDNQGNLISIFAPDTVLENIIPRGTVTINSGGNTYTLNPYPVIVGAKGD